MSRSGPQRKMRCRVAEHRRSGRHAVAPSLAEAPRITPWHGGGHVNTLRCAHSEVSCSCSTSGGAGAGCDKCPQLAQNTRAGIAKLPKHIESAQCRIGRVEVFHSAPSCTFDSCCKNWELGLFNVSDEGLNSWRCALRSGRTRRLFCRASRDFHLPYHWRPTSLENRHLQNLRARRA